jgi:hypothetical protein
MEGEDLFDRQNSKRWAQKDEGDDVGWAEGRWKTACGATE